MYSPFPLIHHTASHYFNWTPPPTLQHALSIYHNFTHLSLPLPLHYLSLPLSNTHTLSPRLCAGFIRRQVSEAWIHTRHENVMPLFSLHSPCLVNCRLRESGRWLRAQVCVFVRVMHKFAWFGSESNENGRKCRGDVWRYIQSICVSSVRVVPCVSYHDLYGHAGLVASLLFLLLYRLFLPNIQGCPPKAEVRDPTFKLQCVWGRVMKLKSEV